MTGRINMERDTLMIIDKNYHNVTHAFLDVEGQTHEIDGDPAVLLLLLTEHPDGITRLEMLEVAPPNVALRSSDHISFLRWRGIQIKTIRSAKGRDYLRYQLLSPVMISGGVLIRDQGFLSLERLGAKSVRHSPRWIS